MQRNAINVSNPRHKIERGEFAETAMRHYCRNPKCRMRLPKPVSNEREAFCTRGCYDSFYLHRCRVCEGPIEQKRRPRIVCKKSKCRNAWDAHMGFGRYAEPPCRENAQGKRVNSGFERASKPVRGWKQIAGPTLTPSQFHRATVPDGPNCQWKGGDYERTEAKNRAALKEAEEAEIAANGDFTDPDWREVISPDGVRCFVTKFPTPRKPITMERIAEPLPDDLGIPSFLKREAATKEARKHQKGKERVA